MTDHHEFDHSTLTLDELLDAAFGPSDAGIQNDINVENQNFADVEKPANSCAAPRVAGRESLPACSIISADLPNTPPQSTLSDTLADLIPDDGTAPSKAPFGEREALELRNAVLFASEAGKPLNAFLTVVYRDHDDAQTTGLDAIRRRVNATITAQLPDRGKNACYLYVVENPAGGGRGQHVHILLHVPVQDFDATAAGITSALAKSHRNRLQALCRAHKIPFRARTSPATLYSLLRPGKRLADRAAVEACLACRISRPVPALLSAAQTRAVLRDHHSLPFYFAFEEGKEGQPLEQEYVLHKLLPYLLKGVDPSIQVQDRYGITRLLAELDRALGGDVTLQRQSATRMPDRPTVISYAINRTAQLKAGWPAPAEPIAATLSQSVRLALRKAQAVATLRAFQVKQSACLTEASKHSDIPNAATCENSEAHEQTNMGKDIEHIYANTISEQQKFCYNIALDKRGRQRGERANQCRPNRPANRHQQRYVGANQP